MKFGKFELSVVDVLCALAFAGLIYAILLAREADAASSRAAYCATLARGAVVEYDSAKGTELKPEHYAEEWQQQAARWAEKCVNDPRGQEACVKITCESFPS